MQVTISHCETILLSDAEVEQVLQAVGATVLAYPTIDFGQTLIGSEVSRPLTAAVQQNIGAYAIVGPDAAIFSLRPSIPLHPVDTIVFSPQSVGAKCAILQGPMGSPSFLLLGTA